MQSLRLPEPRGRFGDWPLALKSILGFWLFYMATVVLRGVLSEDGAQSIRFRLISALVGIGLSALIYLALRAFARDGSVRRMGITAAIAALPASALLSYVSLTLVTESEPLSVQTKIETREGGTIIQRGSDVRIVRSDGREMRLTLPPMRKMMADKMPRLVADGALPWYFFFAAWSAFFIAMTTQNRVRAAERRLAEAETAAQTAQVRALRYQVNPHFLFNTLNSLSSLVMSGRSAQAEEMLLALSTFFRTSLSLEPSADVTLAEEIALQRLYLDIEQVRFPERLKVETDVPPELEGVRLPALILQPIVENAIKYGVSASKDQVVVRIAATRAAPAMLRIEVANSGSPGTRARRQPMHSGTGLGLANVRQRLTARFGGRATCEAGPADDGGYRVTLTVPMNADD